MAELAHAQAVDAVADALPAGTLSKQARFAQALQVLGHARLRERERFNNTATGGLAPFLQELDDADACRVSERGRTFRQFAGFV